MAVNPHDPRPQAKIYNSAAANGEARRGAYTDTAITKNNVSETPAAVVPVPSGSTTLGEVTVYDREGTNHKPGAQGAVTPPHSPNKWAIAADGNVPLARDHYRNGGMLGQSFFENQG